MKKSFLLQTFGGVIKTAKALNITKGAVSKWPEDLPDGALGRVVRVQPDFMLGWLRQQKKLSRKTPKEE